MGLVPQNASGVASAGGAASPSSPTRAPTGCSFRTRVDRHQGSLPRLLLASPSASRWGWPWAGSGWPKGSRAPFRIHPAHPAHRVDSADHLLVRHRPTQGVHHLIGGIVPCVINLYAGVHDQPGLFSRWALRRDELAAFLDGDPRPCRWSARRSRWRGADESCGRGTPAANGGLGFLIQCGRKLGRPDLVVLGMVTVAMTGVFIGILIHYVEKKLAGMRSASRPNPSPTKGNPDQSRERRPLRLDDILMNRWFLHTVSVSLFGRGTGPSTWAFSGAGYAIPMKCCRNREPHDPEARRKGCEDHAWTPPAASSSGSASPALSASAGVLHGHQQVFQRVLQ